MQYAAAVALFASLFAALAAAQVAQTPAPYFQIYNFQGLCFQYSDQCLYDFYVLLAGVDSGEAAPGVHCQKVVQSLPPGIGFLPDVANPNKDNFCMDSNRSWAVGHKLPVSDGSLRLTVLEELSPGNWIGGEKVFPIAELVVEQDGDSEAMRYIGPSDFALDAYYSQ